MERGAYSPVEPGNRYGRLVVVEEAGRSKQNKRLWKCRCDCGSHTVVVQQALKMGETKSCGCIKTKGAPLQIGQRCGRLTIKARAEKGPQGGCKWLCLCDCGREKVVLQYSLKAGSVRSCGCISGRIYDGDTKPCGKCGVVKTLEQFAPSSRGALGRKSSCRSCEKAYQGAREFPPAPPGTVKICISCGQGKDIGEFHRDKKQIMGVRGSCKMCVSLYYGTIQERRKVLRKRHNLKKFDLTQEQYDQMERQQGYGCAICGLIPGEHKRKLAVDHDHKTGRVRGLLCSNCNTAIGLANEDPYRLIQITHYLIKNLPNS